MTLEAKGPPRGGSADGPIELSFPGGNEVQTLSPIEVTAQDKKRTPHLRLVPPTPPPRPRRVLEVRISAVDARSPYGRTRQLRLTHEELAELIDYALRLEGRA